jgi:hypothetical protein
LVAQPNKPPARRIAKQIYGIKRFNQDFRLSRMMQQQLTAKGQIYCIFP